MNINDQNKDVSSMEVSNESHVKDQKTELQKGSFVCVPVENNSEFFYGTVKDIYHEGSRTRVEVHRKWDNNTQDFDLSDKIHVMRSNQQFDIREVDHAFQGKLYGKKLDQLKDENGKSVLYPLLNGWRTNVVAGLEIRKKTENENGDKKTMNHKFDGKIKLYRKNGKLKSKVEIRKPELQRKEEIFGVKFTDEMWDRLEKEGHLGLVENFAIPKGEGTMFNGYVSLDRELNDVVIVNEKAIDISNVYKTELTEKQQTELKKGNSITIDADMGPSGIKNVTVRVDATKEGITVKENTPKQAEAQNQEKKKSKGVKI